MQRNDRHPRHSQSRHRRTVGRQETGCIRSDRALEACRQRRHESRRFPAGTDPAHGTDHIDSAMTAKKKAVPEETMVMPPIRAHKSQEKATPSSSRHRSSNRPRRRGSNTDVRCSYAQPVAGQCAALRVRMGVLEDRRWPVVRQCVSHFLRQYGVVSPDLQQQTEYITSAAFDQICEM